MKELINKKNIQFLIFSILISICLSLVFEIFVFNINVIKHNQYKSKVKILEAKGFKEKNGYLISVKDEAFILIKSKRNYVNKINFDYDSENDFSWNISLLNEGQEQKEITNKSASIINKAVRKINDSPDIIKLSFYSKGIKIKNIETSNKLLINPYRMIIMIITIFSLIIAMKYREIIKKNLAISAVIIGAIVGLIIIIVTPVTVYTSNDDQVHFNKIYTLLDGNSSKWSFSGRYFNHLIIGSQDRFKSIEEIREYKKFLNRNNTKESTIAVENGDSRIDYNEIIYLPYSIGMKLARIFNTNFTTMIYISKLFNLIVYLVMIYFAIKIVPYGKKTMFIISLLPTNLYLASQFSYDSTITAGVMLGFGSLLKLKAEDNFSKKYFLIFILSILWASLPKAIYCPILLLGLFIPNNKFETKKQAKIIKIGIILLFIVMMLSFVLPAVLGQTAGDTRVQNTSVSGQLSYIIHNPFNYAKILCVETLTNLSDMFFGYGALGKMGYLTFSSLWFFNLSYFITLFLLLYVTFTDNTDIKVINNRFKLILIVLLAMIWCLIWTSLYLSWNPVGAQSIGGVQSRYFLPLLFILLLIFIPGISKYKKEYKMKNHILIYIIPLLINLYNLFYIVIKFYK